MLHREPVTKGAVASAAAPGKTTDRNSAALMHITTQFAAVSSAAPPNTKHSASPTANCTSSALWADRPNRPSTAADSCAAVGADDARWPSAVTAATTTCGIALSGPMRYTPLQTMQPQCWTSPRQSHNNAARHRVFPPCCFGPLSSRWCAAGRPTEWPAPQVRCCCRNPSLFCCRLLLRALRHSTPCARRHLLAPLLAPRAC